MRLCKLRFREAPPRVSLILPFSIYGLVQLIWANADGGVLEVLTCINCGGRAKC